MDDILENVEAARRAGINAFVFENQEQAKQMLSENREVMDHLAEFLIKEETITGKEFMEIFHKYRLEQMERQVGMDVSDNTNE